MTFALQAVPVDASEDRARIESAYAGMSSRYTRFREFIDYRYKLTTLLLGGFLLLELVAFAAAGRAPVAASRLRQTVAARSEKSPRNPRKAAARDHRLVSGSGRR